jgi:hypothetical protein
MIYNISFSNGNRYDVIQYILKKKALGKFTVIDIGGVFNGWSAPYIDAIIDFNCKYIQNSDNNIKLFNLDITDPNKYSENIFETLNQLPEIKFEKLFEYELGEDGKPVGYKDPSKKPETMEDIANFLYPLFEKKMWEHHLVDCSSYLCDYSLFPLLFD